VNLNRRAIVVALLLASSGPPVWAQAVEKDAAIASVREAFASPYGKALTSELGKSLRASADPTCLAEKGLKVDQLEPRGRDLIIKWAMRMADGATSTLDPTIVTNAFVGSPELQKLKRNADVKRYLALAEPRDEGKLLDLIFEYFDRYNLITGVKLGAVSPLSTGNEALLKLNPADASEDAMEKFVSKSRSKALKRFLELSERSVAAQSAAIKKIENPPPRPYTFFKGVESDLAELCIRTGK
jgi:hypothetical protein